MSISALNMAAINHLSLILPLNKHKLTVIFTIIISGIFQIVFLGQKLV